MTALQILAIVGMVAGGITALTVIGKAGRWLFRFGRRIVHFLDDWFGEEERDGVPARLGVMARLQAMEAELHPNGGESLVDRVAHIEEMLVDSEG